MKSWSTWKRRTITKMRTCNSCLGCGEVGTGAGVGTAGPKGHNGLVCCRVGSTRDRRRWNSKGSAASKLIPPFASPLCDPPRLLAVFPGVTAQIWAGFGPCVEVSACSGCVQCAPLALGIPTGEGSRISLNRCQGVNCPSLWLGENRWAAKKSQSLFGHQTAAGTMSQIVWQRPFPCQHLNLQGFSPSKSSTPQGP